MGKGEKEMGRPASGDRSSRREERGKERSMVGGARDRRRDRRDGRWAGLLKREPSERATGAL